MYNIKHYSKSKTLLQTIGTRKLSNISNFQAQSNGWFGELDITLDLRITNQDFDLSDIIEVYYKWNFIYSWYILDVEKLYWTEIETVTIVIVWYSSLLTDYIISENYNDLASNIVKDLIDKANIEYWYNIFSYDAISIPNTTWNININFDNINYLEALEELSEISWINFFVDLDWKVYFSNTRNNHKLTLRKDVQDLDIVEEWRELVNSIILNYSWWTQSYEDTASINQYWKKQKYVSKQDIQDLQTADEFGLSYLTEKSIKQKKISIIVNNKYNYFDIKPDDTIRIRNSLYEIQNLRVKRIRYDYETARIELGKIYSFAKEIFDNN